MKESAIDMEVVFVTDEQTPEVAEPGEGALDLPAFAVATQRAAILGGRSPASLPVRANQLDVSPRQPGAQRIAVVGAIGDQSPRSVGQKQPLD